MLRSRKAWLEKICRARCLSRILDDPSKGPEYGLPEQKWESASGVEDFIDEAVDAMSEAPYPTGNGRRLSRALGFESSDKKVNPNTPELSVGRSRSASHRFVVFDNYGLADLERQALDDALELVQRNLTENSLGEYARGNVLVGEFPGNFVARYVASDDSILLNASKMNDRSRRVLVFRSIEAIYHEIGHRVFQNLPLQWRSWYEFEFGTSSEFVTPYARKNATEDFSETFRFVAVGKQIPLDVKNRFSEVIGKAKLG